MMDCHKFESVESATRAKEALHGCDIYSGCCTLKIEFAKFRTFGCSVQAAVPYLTSYVALRSELSCSRTSEVLESLNLRRDLYTFSAKNFRFPLRVEQLST
ncbi:hypothetical protein K1T71_013977 [Dendrolimus kikuchii]|uniref:Uncharacterized protein n=1 Tax=Dendrolimus kikuchii TaxID=765133 RepID=A0ACC1CGA3_9NEOP|nr:hypothetical protein K1T71_013977 [Dendrolimus kikuchii]